MKERGRKSGQSTTGLRGRLATALFLPLILAQLTLPAFGGAGASCAAPDGVCCRSACAVPSNCPAGTPAPAERAGGCCGQSQPEPSLASSACHCTAPSEPVAPTAAVVPVQEHGAGSASTLLQPERVLSSGDTGVGGSIHGYPLAELQQLDQRQDPPLYTLLSTLLC
jgi:hypothetical protein